MINRISYTPQYQQKPIFKGEKEAKMIADMANNVPKHTGKISSFNDKLHIMLKKKEITRQDIGEAAKQTKTFLKGFLEELAKG